MHIPGTRSIALAGGINMSLRARFVLFALSTSLAGAGAWSSGCGGLEVLSLVNNDLATRLLAGSSTIYTGQSVIFTATTTDENPDRPFVATRYKWSVDGVPVTTTTVNYAALSFDVAGRHSVEVTIDGHRTSTDSNGGTATYGAPSDSAMLNVYVEDAPDDSSSSGSGGSDQDEPPTVSVSISGPSELMAGGKGSYTASADGARVDLTWRLSGDSGTLGPSSGQTTTVTGTKGGSVTLVAEARDINLGNVLATAQKTISIMSEYVVWYTGNVDCWGAPRVYVTTREDFNRWRATASITGGGNDWNEELIKIEMKGGFESRQAALDWICTQFTSRFKHYWCSAHYKLGGTYYTNGNLECDFDSLPLEKK
jgi:hypothetical protein